MTERHGSDLGGVHCWNSPIDRVVTGQVPFCNSMFGDKFRNSNDQRWSSSIDNKRALSRGSTGSRPFRLSA